ncbi:MULTISPECIES: alpha/beta hydrolase [Nocardiaceae]|uniref:alpha/beta hydrolase n=1 Tax=Nocardiaceae TaxID=85025 RepID=UPI00068A81AC|nr:MULTISPECIES: alpha/beta hydrolase [Rhodococcus]OZD12092.1 hypothetical protein CH248_29265 [Rhodococcus sp. 06-156-4a]OZD15761.1 hypothetical protein CH253_22605 [Rhodococcus sp. 06-156-3C]OZD21145.1 hypothetical protein CH280_02835 [Rhodococcus sp. 06-156-4C]OZD32328.1 hypothetical protein CH284_20765 [Rhodococcus sp. 06-156-3]OZD36549.1 hypothetical protein CH247_03190 [Rhodococcus sp. 06-156-3b]
MPRRTQPGLDSDIARILCERSAAGNVPTWALTPDQARKASIERVAQGDSELAVDNIVEIEMNLPGRNLCGRLYRQNHANDVVIVFFHGGGFVTGDLDTHDRQARMLCVDTGQMVLSVQYRLAPEHPFPAAYDDGVDSVRWTWHNLAEFTPDIPPRSVAVAGSSAGANLAAGAARVLAGSPFAPIAQLLVYPLLGGRDDLASRTQMADGYGLSTKTLNWYLAHYIPKKSDRSDIRFAPLCDDQFASLPPSVIAAAGYDPLRDDARMYAHRLRTSGTPVMFLEFETLNHAFWGLADRAPEAGRASSLMCRAFRDLVDSEVRRRTAGTK